MDSASPSAAERFERALGLAYRHLGRRDRSVAEVRAHLAAREVAPEVADAVVAELGAQGYLDDARYAQRFAEDRRALDGWGAQRIAQRLAAAGVAREHVDAALATLGDAATGELEAAVAVLERRVPVPPADTRERDRALRLLVRRGFALEVAYEAVRTHAGRVASDVGEDYDPAHKPIGP